MTDIQKLGRPPIMKPTSTAKDAEEALTIPEMKMQAEAAIRGVRRHHGSNADRLKGKAA